MVYSIPQTRLIDKSTRECYIEEHFWKIPSPPKSETRDKIFKKQNFYGAVAQLGECLHGMQKVTSSILVSSISQQGQAGYPMATQITLKLIGLIEILIGGTTLASNLLSVFMAVNPKTLNVFWFVMITGIISTLVGVGILKFKKLAYQLLIYFASVILLSKILILADIIHLNGELETTIPTSIKNLISIFYHGFIVLYLSRKNVKSLFNK